MALTIIKIAEALINNVVLNSKKFGAIVHENRQLSKDIGELALCVANLGIALNSVTSAISIHNEHAKMQEKIAMSHREALEIHDRVLESLLKSGEDPLFDMKSNKEKNNTNKPN